MADPLVVMPTYNEAENIESVVRRVLHAVPQARVLVVDDASPDGTGALADKLAEQHGRVRVLHRNRKQGLGPAYLAGFRLGIAAGHEYIVAIDSDGSHDPAEIPVMLELAANQDADLVLGSRWIPGGSVVDWAWPRRVISRAGNAYARRVLRSHAHDLTSGFRVYRADTLAGIHLEAVSSHGYGFQVELAWLVERSGGKLVEHPITFVERARGRSKMHLGIVLEALARVTKWGLLGRR